MGEILIFFKIVPLEFNTVLPASFTLVEASLKLFKWRQTELRHIYAFHVLKS